MSEPTTLLQAVVALLDGSAVFADLAASGGFWLGGIPEEKTALPFGAIVHGGEVPQWNTEGGVVQELGSFSLHVFAGGTSQAGAAASAEALAADIKAVLDPSSTPAPGQTSGDFVQLPLETATSAWIERQNYFVRLSEFRAQDGTWVYEVEMPYKAEVAKLI